MPYFASLLHYGHLVVIILDTIRSIPLPLRTPRPRNRETCLSHLLRIAPAPASVDSSIRNHQDDCAKESTGDDDRQVSPSNDVQWCVVRSEYLWCSDAAEVGCHGDEGHAQGAVLGVACVESEPGDVDGVLNRGQHGFCPKGCLLVTHDTTPQ
jgi:hypothetical protein